MRIVRRVKLGCGRLVSAAVVLVVLAGVAAAEEGLLAGAAKVDITPPAGVSLDGPISKNGPVTAVHDPLHARALVLDAGGVRVAIVVCDACMIGRDVLDAAKARVVESSQIPVERILIAATHTHAAVRAVHIGTSPLDEAYHENLAQRIAQAILKAERQLAPARIGYASFDKPDLIACRRFLCEPGSVAANPFGQEGERIKSVAGRSSAVIKPAGPVDPQFSVVMVQHADGRPLCLLGNFSVHYHGGYRRGEVSADYFGHFAEAVEAKFKGQASGSEVVAIMSNGTSGDTGSFQRGNRKFAPYEGMKFYGQLLAEEAVRAVEAMTFESSVEIEMVESELAFRVRRPGRDRLQWARNVLAHPESDHGHRWAKVYAQEALHLDGYPQQVRHRLQVIRIGAIGIAAAPCEVFAETGLKIKRASPHRHTFVMELANGYGGYLPSAEQHAAGGYETWPARSSYLEVEAELRIRDELLRLLRAVE